MTQNDPGPIKVLYVTSSPHLAGAERCLLNLVTHIDHCQYLPIVLVPGEGGLAHELRKRNIDVRVFDLATLENKRELRSIKLILRFYSMFVATIKLSRLIKREQINIVHSNTSGVLVGAFASVLARVPHLWHVREILEEPRWLWAVMSRLIQVLSCRVVCVSSGVRDHFGSAPWKIDKLIVVHDSIDADALVGGIDEKFHLNNDCSTHNFNVGMLARVNPWKGHAIFLEAAASVIQMRSDVDFYLAGGCLPAYRDVLSSLEQYIASHSLAEKVEFKGDLSFSQVAAFISELDVLVLSSTSPEPFGLTMLEAMAFGKPVIASDAGGPRDVVVHGVTGLLVPPGDPEALAQAIINLIEDDRLREAMGKAGKHRLLEHFGLEANVKSIESVYDQVIELQNGNH